MNYNDYNLLFVKKNIIFVNYMDYLCMDYLDVNALYMLKIRVCLIQIYNHRTDSVQCSMREDKPQ